MTISRYARGFLAFYLPLVALLIVKLQSSSALSAVTGDSPRFLGFDLGTSGARISIIEPSATTKGFTEVYSDSVTWDEYGSYDNADSWKKAVESLLAGASTSSPSSTREKGLLASVKSICVSGTSASCVMVQPSGDNNGPSSSGANNNLVVTRSPRMYNYDVGSGDSDTCSQVMEYLNKHAPPKHTARATTGSLAKLLSWHLEQPLQPGEVLCHQSDYISSIFLSNCGERKMHSDWHNCLKLGFDVRALKYPDWWVSCLEDAGFPDPLQVVPQNVVSPGQPVGTVSDDMVKRFGFGSDTVVVGGTTDSNAAFVAAVGGTTPSYGTAVTSLGSTVAMKQLSRTYVEDADRGVYSHRFPNFGGGSSSGSDSTGQEEAWLIGGASNVGCAVLRQEEFSNEELETLSVDLDPTLDSPLQYYPLTKKGERFPTADSERLPVLEPKPESRLEYLHGILQGIGDVERDGFEVLGQLGASPSYPTEVLTCGGGSQNDKWMQMRERRLSAAFDNDAVKVIRAPNTEASFGAAILASATFE